MKLTKEQLDFLKKNEVVFLGTCAGGAPRVCIVAPWEFSEDKIIVADCEMGNTNKNIKDNKNVFILSCDKNSMDDWIKISGTADYESSGDLFEKVRADVASDGYVCKGVITIGLESISGHKGK